MSSISVWMPPGAKSIIRKLKMHGFDAYIVGGCVRDGLLHLTPHDWDICTNARPVEVLKCFSENRVIETGLKHGTVTIVQDDGQYEVTTFRIDGTYSDNRHPDKVTFTSELNEDLSRRDFTMNAMAYGPDGLVDPFGGVNDLQDGVIRCVGNPDDRFAEDALRILRAMRFASTYGFHIADDTANAIHRNKDRLNNIAAERIQSELCKMLVGRGVLNVLLEFSDVMAAIIPELGPCIGFDQNNKYHEYTVYDHIAHTVANYRGPDISIKMALLLHDIGKPMCYTEDHNGGHFHGHAVPGREIAETVMNRLRFDNKTKSEVLELVLYHDAVIEPKAKVVKRWLNKVGENRFEQLLKIRMADILAHAKGTQQSRIDRCMALESILVDVLQEEQCFSMKDLAIGGAEVMMLGIPQGKLVGETLNYVLDMVINGDIPNEAGAEIDAAKKYLAEQRHG